MERQELIDRIQKVLDKTVPNSCYKKRAFEELEDIDKYPNTKFILDQYPNFDHLKISLSSNEDDFIIEFRLNLALLKNDTSAVEQVADWLLPILEQYDYKIID